MRFKLFIYVLPQLLAVLEAKVSIISQSSSVQSDANIEARHVRVGSAAKTEIKRSLDLEISPVIRSDEALKIHTPTRSSFGVEADLDDRVSESQSQTHYFNLRDSSLLKRSKDTFSAPISQDGRDRYYIVNATLGSKNTKMSLLLDTSTELTWVMSNFCDNQTCKKHILFEDDSDSLRSTDVPFYTGYDIGLVEGYMYSDSVVIGEISNYIYFGLAYTVSDDFYYGNFKPDGILGLAPLPDSYFIDMVRSKTLDRNIFAVSLSRTTDMNQTGVISFGSIDESRYTGDLKYYDMVSDDSWVIKLGGYGFENQPDLFLSRRSVLFNTGIKIITGPRDDMKELYNSIPGKVTHDGIIYCVPCNTTIDFKIKLETDVYTIPARSWIGPNGGYSDGCDLESLCVSFISGSNNTDGMWEIGDAFLKDYYVVFDYDHTRIGLANSSALQSTSPPSQANSTQNDPADQSSDIGSSHPVVSIGPGLNLAKPHGSDSYSTRDTKSILGLLSIAISFGSLMALGII